MLTIFHRHSDGYSGTLVGIDYAESVVNAMSRKYSSVVGLSFKKMDVRDLKFPDSSVDAFIDKVPSIADQNNTAS
jgi:ubiquinone/menaquinone biosynthesis C-methylase UbiE